MFLNSYSVRYAQNILGKNSVMIITYVIHTYYGNFGLEYPFESFTRFSYMELLTLSVLSKI